MKRIQYTGASPLNYDSVIGRSWSPGESDSFDDATGTALVAAGNFSDVTSSFSASTGLSTSGGALSAPDLPALISTYPPASNAGKSAYVASTGLFYDCDGVAWYVRRKLNGLASALLNAGLADRLTSSMAAVSSWRASAATVFAESWANLTNWTAGANPQQVSAGRVYAGATVGTGSGMNHALSLGAGNLHIMVPVTIPATATTGGIAIGLDNAAANAAPTAGLASMVVGLEMNRTNGVRRWDNGVATVLSASLATGNFTFEIDIDATTISLTIKEQVASGGLEFYYKVARGSVTFNNLQIFNSCGQQLSGISCGPMAARLALQTVFPLANGEANGSFRWTGDGSTYNRMVWTPVGYDSRSPAPLAIMWHGDTGDETFAAGASGNASAKLMRDTLLANGYIVMSTGLITNKRTWGAPLSTDAYFDSYKYVRDNYNIGPVVFVAQSMGGIESMNALADNKIPGVVAWFGYSPAASLAWAYANTWQTQIDAAYGTPYATKTDGFDPMLMPQARFRGLPMMFVAAIDDALVSKASNTDAMAARMLGVAQEVISITAPSGGHSFDMTPYLSSMVSFLNRYVAQAT